MSTINTMITVEPDGSARIDTPAGLAAGRHHVVLLVSDDDVSRDTNGWPSGFFAQTYSSCADDPIPGVVSEPSQERDSLL